MLFNFGNDNNNNHDNNNHHHHRRNQHQYHPIIIITTLSICPLFIRIDIRLKIFDPPVTIFGRYKTYQIRVGSYLKFLQNSNDLNVEVLFRTLNNFEGLVTSFFPSTLVFEATVSRRQRCNNPTSSGVVGAKVRRV